MVTLGERNCVGFPDPKLQSYTPNWGKGFAGQRHIFSGIVARVQDSDGFTENRGP